MDCSCRFGAPERSADSRGFRGQACVGYPATFSQAQLTGGAKVLWRYLQSAQNSARHSSMNKRIPLPDHDPVEITQSIRGFGIPCRTFATQGLISRHGCPASHQAGGPSGGWRLLWAVSGALLQVRSVSQQGVIRVYPTEHARPSEKAESELAEIYAFLVQPFEREPFLLLTLPDEA